MRRSFVSPAFVVLSSLALLACESPTPTPAQQTEKPDATVDTRSGAPTDAAPVRNDGSANSATTRADAAADRSNDRTADLAPTCGAGKTMCGQDCTDLQTDDNHCGDCATLCSGGSDCQAGKCVCPTGQTLCDSSCVDTSTSTSHCGGCDKTCASGQSCGSGTCVGQGSTSTPSDGCTDTLASNVTLKQIAVYQTVKIPVMTDMKEVAASARTADVVAGKDALVRVFVTVGGGWTSRSLSARLTLTVDGTSKIFSSKQTIAASSAEGTLPNSFPIQVPASDLSGAARYSVQVVECATASGSAGQARFPATGDTDLGVRTTGGLKIKIIPIKVGSLTPDTSSTALDVYSKTMRAMYPINAIDISVGDSITATSPVDWVKMVDQIRAKRQTDAPASDVYYFGLVKPAATMQAYCGSACTTGIGYVVAAAKTAAQRAAVGVGFADRYSAETMAHEVGHNHGRNHSPCVSGGGSIDGVDPQYPYSKAALGSWGYDPRTQTLIDPSRSTDIMGYCSNKWMSDYTYKGITDRVAGLNGQALMLFSPDAMNRWRVLLVDEKGPRWGIPIDQETLADGTPEQATVYDQAGNALDTITVYRTEISDIDAASIMVPEPKPNWYAVQIAGAPPYPFTAP